MILSKENLKNIKTENVSLPEERLFRLPEKVLQFGTGVLLRGLPDYFIDQANRKGVFNGRIVVVKSTSTGGTSDFQQQDNLYTICVRGILNAELVEENVISSAISRVISAEKDWSLILDFARQPDLKLVVSNTTEVGISLLEESIHQHPPVSFPAKLLAVLYERYSHFNGSPESGLVIVATELISENGQKLKAIVSELAVFNAFDARFMNWLNLHNEFCNSLVDRIVPGKPDQQTTADLTQHLGYEDNLLCMVEPYCLWAIEGNEKVAAALSFKEAGTGVVVTTDIELFRELKVRLLNGTHTLSSGIAVLAGIDTVKNAMGNTALKDYIKLLMQQEISISIPYPVTKEDAMAFSETVQDRFANPYIEHLWINITAQYTMKMKIRVLPLLVNYFYLHGTVPAHMTFGFAAFLQFMRTVEKDGKFIGGTSQNQYVVNDDSAAYFWAQNRDVSATEYADRVLNDHKFWMTDLDSLPGFIPAVKAHFNKIQEQDMLTAMSSVVNLNKV